MLLCHHVPLACHRRPTQHCTGRCCAGSGKEDAKRVLADWGGKGQKSEECLARSDVDAPLMRGRMWMHR